MSAIPAVYENGVFRPLGPVDLPEKCEVEVVPKRDQEPVTEIGSSDEARVARNMDAVYEILSHRHRSGRSDLSERHNEHQP